MNTMLNSAIPVVALEIDENGQALQKTMKLTRQAQLENTLLEALYPGIRVATVDIPEHQLDGFQQAQVEDGLARIKVGGIEYRLIGASGSAKNGKYYAVDVQHEKVIADRFQHWPEAAITYFGILVSPCKVRIQRPEVTVMVVDDGQLGTNDCRGWIRRSLFADLKLPPRHFYQFRLAFDKTQAKGSFKVMEDDVAAILSADIVLPKSAVKPALKGKPRLLQFLTGDVQIFRGPIVLGIREISRPLSFESSYTLLAHAPAESIEHEVKPHALEQVRKVRRSAEENDFEELFRLIGTSDSLRPTHGEEEPDDASGEYTSSETTIVEAVTKADATGFLVKHPFINRQLQRTLCRWAYKLCTAGGFRLPAFALADDGYLFAHEGKVCCGSDWIPEDHAVTSLGSARLLEVRYPIRSLADLLPLTNLNAPATVEFLMRDLARQRCSMSEQDAVQQVVIEQLRLEHTLTLNSRTAAKNGGDFDFDVVCVIEGSRFPRWVEHRFTHQPASSNQKQKLRKRQSPWWNLPQVAYAAKGNQIGVITDLMTSCLAVARPDLAESLATELQAALDQLKHGTEPNADLIADVRKQVKTAPWLRLKNAQYVNDLPEHLDVAPTDKIGNLYNLLRKEVGEFFSDVRPLSDFRGLIVGVGQYDREMYQQAGMISTVYATNVALIVQKKKKYQAELDEAQAALDVVDQTDRKARREAAGRRAKAQAALRFYEERSRQELRNLIHLIRKWAERKAGNAMGWLAALHAIASKGRGGGSIVFYAFPQELVNKIVESTGGRPVTVAIPDLIDGEVVIEEDGSVFLVEDVDDGQGQMLERATFLMQVKDGQLILDHGRPQRIRPFRFDPGRSEVRGGKVVFPGSAHRPRIPQPKSA
jgi:hypothetical protein